MTNSSTIQQKIVLTTVSTHVILELNSKKFKKIWGQWRKLRQGEHAENVWNERWLPLGTMDTDHSRNQDFALICKHLGKESSFIVSQGFLVFLCFSTGWYHYKNGLSLYTQHYTAQISSVFIVLCCRRYYYIRSIIALYKNTV